MSVTDQEGRVRGTTEVSCKICNETLHTSFTDFHAQATCNNCGAPYMLWGKRDKSEYPFLDLNAEFKAVFQEYWDKTGERCRIGSYMGYRDYPGVPDELRKLTSWLEVNHPEFLSDE